MPAKKSQHENKKDQPQKGKKGGRTSRTNQQEKKDTDTPIEYVEVDEFTLDDLPSSRS